MFAADEELLATVLDEAGGWRMIPEGRMDTLVAGLAHLSDETVMRFPRLVLARVYHAKLASQTLIDANAPAELNAYYTLYAFPEEASVKGRR